MGLLSFWSSSEPTSSSSTSIASRTPSPTPDVVHTGQKETNTLNPQGLKPCCACPETKAVRDDCFLKNSPEEAGEKCRELVEAHKACMRGYGFKV